MLIAILMQKDIIVTILWYTFLWNLLAVCFTDCCVKNNSKYMLTSNLVVGIFITFLKSNKWINIMFTHQWNSCLCYNVVKYYICVCICVSIYVFMSINQTNNAFDNIIENIYSRLNACVLLFASYLALFMLHFCRGDTLYILTICRLDMRIRFMYEAQLGWKTDLVCSLRKYAYLSTWLLHLVHKNDWWEEVVSENELVDPRTCCIELALDKS